MLSSRASRDNGDVVRETDVDRRRRRTAAARACTGIRAFLVDQPRGRHAIRSLRPAGLARKFQVFMVARCGSIRMCETVVFYTRYALIYFFPKTLSSTSLEKTYHFSSKVFQNKEAKPPKF